MTTKFTWKDYAKNKEDAANAWAERDALIDQQYNEGMKDEPDQKKLNDLKFEIERLAVYAKVCEDLAQMIYNDLDMWESGKETVPADELKELEAENADWLDEKQTEREALTGISKPQQKGL